MAMKLIWSYITYNHRTEIKHCLETQSTTLKIRPQHLSFLKKTQQINSLKLLQILNSQCNIYLATLQQGNLIKMN